MADREKDEVRFVTSNTVVRRVGDRYQTGLIRPAVEGQNIEPGSELVEISEQAGAGGWRTVRSIYKAGPPQVATKAYCEGYERIFGKKPGVC